MDEYVLESARLMREAIDLFNDEKWSECTVALYALSNRRLAQWQRIHCYILLATAVEDWYEGEDCRYAAEALFDNVRLFWPSGESRAFDVEMDGLRTRLDQLRAQQKEERPDDYAENEQFQIDMYWKWSSIMERERNTRAEEQAARERWEAEIDAMFAEEEAELAEAQREERFELAENELQVRAERAEGQVEHEAELAEGDDEAQTDQHDTSSDVLQNTDAAALYQTANELTVDFKDQIKDVATEHQEQAKAVGDKQEELTSKAPNRSAKGKQQVLQLVGDRVHQPCVHNRDIPLGQSQDVNVEVRMFSASGHPDAQRHTTSNAASMKFRYAYDELKSLLSHNLSSHCHNSPGPNSLGRNTMVRSPSRSPHRSKIPLSLRQKNSKASLQGNAGNMHNDRTSILGLNWIKFSTNLLGRVRDEDSRGELRKK